MLLQLNQRSGTFRRCVRDPEGEIKKTLLFPAGETVKVTNKKELAAIARDIAKGMLVEVDDLGKPIPAAPEGPEALSGADLAAALADQFEAGRQSVLAELAPAVTEKTDEENTAPNDAQDANSE